MIRQYVYTIEEASQFIGVNRSTVYRWLKTARLPGEDIGGVVLIPRWAVEMVQAEREAKATRRRPKRPSQAQGGGVAMGYTTVRSHMRDGYGV